MDPVLVRFAMSFAGFFVGTMVWSRTFIWIYSVGIGYRDWHRSTATTRPNIIVLFPVVLIHSGFILLAIAVSGSYYLLSHPHQPEWDWFYQGAGISVFLMVLNAVRVFRQWRKMKAARTPTQA